MTINNKSERNYQGKCLGWPVTSYSGANLGFSKRNVPYTSSMSGVGSVRSKNM